MADYCEFHCEDFNPDEIEVVPVANDEAYYDLWSMQSVRERLSELLADEE